MTVAQLRKELEGVDDNRLVILQLDGEGNSYSPLAGAFTGAYRAESTWAGEIGLEPGEELPTGYGEEDVIGDGVLAFVLQPTN